MYGVESFQVLFCDLKAQHSPWFLPLLPRLPALPLPHCDMVRGSQAESNSFDASYWRDG